MNNVIFLYALMYMDVVNSILVDVSSPQTPVPCDTHWQSQADAPHSSCYRHYALADPNARNYKTARSGCEAVGSMLVTIEDIEENMFVGSIINTFQLAYIGLHKENGTWRWSTGDTGTLDRWGRGHPADGYDCGCITANGFWASVSCDDPRQAMLSSYICEKSTTAPVKSKDEDDYHDATTVELATTVPMVTEEYVSGDLTSDNSLVLTLLLPVFSGLLVLGLILGAGYKCTVAKNKTRQKLQERMRAKPELSDILVSMLDEDKKWKLRKLLVHSQTLEIQGQHGQGAFGIIYKGRYCPDNNPLHVQVVAVKTLRERCIGSQIAGLVEEGILMAEFNHAHVMSIIAVCIREDDGIPMLLMPFMHNGDLKTYLRRYVFDKGDEEEPPEEKQLLLYCLQISRGMEYLADQKVVHRDLAARNCMLDNDLLVKVADFGLTRDIYTSSYYTQDQQKLLPVKWMALECLLFRRFTIESDIWSFGVTMWEVLSLGMVPYPDLDNAEVHKHVRAGTRLEQPEFCTDEMFSLMSNCWEERSEKRPKFPVISQNISDYLANMCGYLDIDGSLDVESCDVEGLKSADSTNVFCVNNNFTPVHDGTDLEHTGFDLPERGI